MCRAPGACSYSAPELFDCFPLTLRWLNESVSGGCRIFGPGADLEYPQHLRRRLPCRRLQLASSHYLRQARDTPVFCSKFFGVYLPLPGKIAPTLTCPFAGRMVFHRPSPFHPVASWSICAIRTQFRRLDPSHSHGCGGRLAAAATARTRIPPAQTESGLECLSQRTGSRGNLESAQYATSRHLRKGTVSRAKALSGSVSSAIKERLVLGR